MMARIYQPGCHRPQQSMHGGILQDPAQITHHPTINRGGSISITSPRLACKTPQVSKGGVVVGRPPASCPCPYCYRASLPRSRIYASPVVPCGVSCHHAALETILDSFDMQTWSFPLPTGAGSPPSHSLSHTRSHLTHQSPLIISSWSSISAVSFLPARNSLTSPQLS